MPDGARWDAEGITGNKLRADRRGTVCADAERRRHQPARSACPCRSAPAQSARPCSPDMELVNSPCEPAAQRQLTYMPIRIEVNAMPRQAWRLSVQGIRYTWPGESLGHSVDRAASPVASSTQNASEAAEHR